MLCMSFIIILVTPILLFLHMDMLIAIVPLPKPTVFFPKACLTVSGTSDAADLTALQGHPPPPQWSDGIAMVASTLFNHLLMVTVRLPLPQCHLLHPPPRRNGRMPFSWLASEPFHQTSDSHVEVTSLPHGRRASPWLA